MEVDWAVVGLSLALMVAGLVMAMEALVGALKRAWYWEWPVRAVLGALLFGMGWLGLS